MRRERGTEMHDRHAEVVETQLYQLHLSAASADIKNVGEEIDVDIRINSPLFAVLNMSQPATMGSSLKQISATHNYRLNECLKNPVIAHFVKSQIDSEVFGRNVVELNAEYLKALYSLRVLVIRKCRRRIIAILNVMRVIERQMAQWAEMIKNWEEDKKQDIDFEQQSWRDMISNFHEFKVDDNGVIHTHDNEGYDVIYEDAVDSFYKLETRLLLIATHFIRLAESDCLPDKVRCLHDVFTCELAFQEAKLNMIVTLLDTFHHCVEKDDLKEIIQKIVDVIYLQVPISLSSPFITSAYNLHISSLRKKTELVFSNNGLPLPLFTVSQALTARISSLHAHRIFSSQKVHHHLLGEICSSLSHVHSCLDVCDLVANNIVTGL
eukprot:757026-Hanusia_phi.AAC.1